MLRVASTVGERLLRKNFVRGDRGSKLTVDLLFGCFTHIYVADFQYQTSQSTHATFSHKEEQ